MIRKIILFGCLFSSVARGADLPIDVIVMKNGDIFRGTILEQDFGKYIQIRFKDGNEKRVTWNQIRTVKKEAVTSEVKAFDAPEETLAIGPVNAQPQASSPLKDPSVISENGMKHVEDSFRVAGGITLSTASTTSDVTNLSTGTGFRLGVSYERPVAGTVYYLYGIEYIRRNIDFKIDGVDGSGDLGLGYIVIPVLSRWHWGSFAVGLGPYVGFNISASGSFEGESSDVSDDVAGVDFGARVYSTVDFSEEESSVFFGMGYDFGFSNINSTGPVKEENRCLFFDFGLRL